MRRLSFTLIEMLIVIAVIAILMALLAPSLRRSLAAARDVECANNMRQLATAQIAYCSDYRGYFKRAINTYGCGVAWQNDAMWQDLLLPYTYEHLGTPDYKTSPNWNQRPRIFLYSVTYGGREFWIPKGIFACPSVSFDDRLFMARYFGDNYTKMRRMDIGMNRELIHWDSRWKTKTARYSSIKEPESTIMFMDMLGANVGGDHDAAGRAIADTNLNAEVIWFEKNSSSYESVLPYRHNRTNQRPLDCFNVACAQGNVRTIPRLLMPVSTDSTNWRNKGAKAKFYTGAFVK